MLKALKSRLKAAEKRILWGFGDDISTPRGRRLARVHTHVSDHAFLRGAWSNLDLVAPGLWRSNQPGAARIDRLAAMGLRAILSLRGPARWSYTLFEEEAAARHGLAFETIELRATALAPPEVYLDLLDRMERMPRPLLIHCKSGADRTGLAAALWLLAVEGASAEEAGRQLSLRYVHRSDTKTGILDHLVRSYGTAQRATGIDLRTWLVEAYDPDAIRRDFRRTVLGKGPAA